MLTTFGRQLHNSKSKDKNPVLYTLIKGFYLALMELSDDQQVAPILRQCALANFKVTIEKRWVFDSKWKVDSYIPEE